MSKMDFEIIAQVLDGITKHFMPKERYFIVNAFADRFAAINPRFNRDKFFWACGITP